MMSSNPFALRLAPHISFGGLDKPLFRSVVGTSDPIANIAWAAEYGFAGVQDPFATLRTPDEQQRIGQALERTGLAGGSFIYAAPHAWGMLWTSTDDADCSALDAQIEESCEVARRIHARHLAVLAPLDASRTYAQQSSAMVENLKRLSPRVHARGLVLCLEAVNHRRVPGLLLNHILDAHRIVTAVAHPGCGLIFDYGHVQAMDGDVLYHLDQVWNEVVAIQVADNPGRIEPGAGELNFERLLDDLRVRQWHGLVELEHGWSQESPEHCGSYLARLHSWSARSMAAAV